MAKIESEATCTAENLKMRDHELAVQATADDAVSGKLSAAALGYLTDPYLKHFSRSHAPERRPPVINRGNFTRVACIDKLIAEFLGTAGANSGAKPQIVSLGAGKDTTFFRLHAAAQARAA